MDEASIQRMAGMVSALTMAVQTLIGTHPDKHGVIAILKQLAEEGPTVMAMNHAGRPAIDRGFRETLEILAKTIEPR